MPNKPKYKVHGIRCSEEEWKAMLETLKRLRGVNTQKEKEKEVLTPDMKEKVTPRECDVSPDGKHHLDDSGICQYCGLIPME